MALRLRFWYLGIFILNTSILLTRGAYEPTNLACTAVDSTTLEFTWTLPAGGSGIVQGYHLDLVRTDGIKVDVLPQIDINGYYTDTYTFYGLGKYGTYQLTMHSYTSSGNQADVTHSCTTQEDIPDGAPQGVNATGISYSDIYVEWTELEEYYRNGILLGYKIIYFAYGSDFPNEVNVSTTTLSYTISSLNYDTWYVVSVLGYTVAGDGPRSTDPDKTWGLFTDAPPSTTKYYCYQAIPDTLEIDWDEMPCTVYVGIIGGLFTFMMIFFCACLSACCGKDKEKKQDQEPRVQHIYHGMGGSSVLKIKMMNFRRRVRDKRNNSVSPYNEEDEGFCEEDDDGFPKNKGDVTTRDIHISSPLPPEDPNELQRTEAPPAKAPVMSKLLNREPSSFDLEMGNTEDPINGFNDEFRDESETGNGGTGSGNGGTGNGKMAGDTGNGGNGEPKGTGTAEKGKVAAAAAAAGISPGQLLEDGVDGDGDIGPEVYPGTGPDLTLLRSGDGFF